MDLEFQIRVKCEKRKRQPRREPGLAGWAMVVLRKDSSMELSAWK
ncbi:hypothetical protein C4K39_5490 [Pseudomonas sessilinigenes]|nr:hypothetical protein C4K39_5490 [Pseudomonas sessilinigenes]